ncbi:MAG: GNAT family N-acetyltransferase [Bryobacteraceae bacterium]|nr:GNAT family N-acetyltransferase [Bryobacteraceae bacterium]
MQVGHTERLWIRTWEAADRDEFCGIAGDPEVMRYIQDGRPWSVARVEKWILRQQRNFEELGYSLFKLVNRGDGSIAGMCGIQPYGEQETEIGWWLRPDAWGRGLATEAAREVLRFGLYERGLAEIVAIADPRNLASIQVMKKLGMTGGGIAVEDGRELVKYRIART